MELERLERWQEKAAAGFVTLIWRTEKLISLTMAGDTPRQS
jgi:hypothetical protein